LADSCSLPTLDMLGLAVLTLAISLGMLELSS
jgi:hypothetical protein